MSKETFKEIAAEDAWFEPAMELREDFRATE